MEGNYGRETREKTRTRIKRKMGIVWLVGILVILLGCLTVYTLKLCKENKELKQAPAINETQEQAGEATEQQSEEQVKYSDNLTDEQNGKLAFYELVNKNELQTEKHNGYYTYIDPFENKYNIKEIKDVVSEKGMMGTDNWAALFKVNVTYVDNNDKTKTMTLAIILEPNHEVQNRGTYDNFTGTTSFVKGFTNLSNEKEDKDAVSVVGIDSKFTELSKAAIKSYNMKTTKTIKYDMNGDGKDEKIQLKKSGNDEYLAECVNLFYNNNKIDKNIYVGVSNILYIVDLDKDDKLLDIVIAGFEENDGFLYFNVYKNTGKTLKTIDYKTSKTVSANWGKEDWVGRFYLNNKNEFFELSNVEICFDKVVTNKYYKVENNKAVVKKSNINEIKKETFKVLPDREMIFYIDHKKFNYEKDYKKHDTFKNGDKIKILDWIDDNEIKAKKNGKTIYIFPGHGYLAG